MKALKMIKKCFLILNAFLTEVLFVLKISNFFPGLFDHVENRLISKFMTT